MGNNISSDGRNKTYENYKTDNFNVFYNDKKIKEATAISFKDLGYGYGMDEFDVFYKNKIIKGVDLIEYKYFISIF